jgi:hypothetical protein
MRELAREKETALEIVCDRENTIAKFRSFVNQVCLTSVCFSLKGSLFFINSVSPIQAQASYE